MPAHNEERHIELLVGEIRSALPDNPTTIIVIDDGSTDTTCQVLRSLRRRDPDFHYISFSRNFGKDAALMAGILASPEVDALITMDGDGQHSPADLSRLILAAERDNADLVIGIRTDRNYQTKLHRLSSEFFYKVFNLVSEVPIPNGLGDFNLFRPPAISAMRQVQERHLFLKGLIAWIGFNPTMIQCQIRPRRSGKGKFSLLHLIRLTADGILSFGSWRLLIWFFVGISISMGAFLYLFVILVERLTAEAVVPGYASLMIVILGLGGFQLLALGILGSYLARTLSESKSRPRFIVRESSLDSRVSIPESAAQKEVL